MSQITAPTIAITLGDATGIGPEVVAKALGAPGALGAARALVVGTAPVLQRALDLTGTPLRARQVSTPDEPVGPGEVAVYGTGEAQLATLPYGQLSPLAGRAAVDWAAAAALLALSGAVAAIATAPLNKEAAHAGGVAEVGHQEIYQTMSGAEQVSTMLVTPGLRVVHLSTHRSLAAACALVTRENVLAKLRLTHDFFARYGIARPRIGVAALNPHGGEHGLIGSEEVEEVAPAVADAREEGIDASGPVPADTVFNQAIDGRYDVVLALYHDQGHIAVKVHGWEESVTMNLGLPFVRTSVDHGTAFDIAGRGIADARGMAAAVRAAAALATGRGLTAF
jgi:4-hydroxythreonine-4-phosphate dehydrogenase